MQSMNIFICYEKIDNIWKWGEKLGPCPFTVILEWQPLKDYLGKWSSNFSVHQYHPKDLLNQITGPHLLLKTRTCHQSQITMTRFWGNERYGLLICLQMKEWQTHALKNYCPLKAKAIRAFRGEVVGERLWCSQTHEVVTCKDPSRHSWTDLIAFCFS